MGKTALAMNIAANAAIEGKVPVGVFSLEMSCEQLGMRMLCSVSRVDAQRLRTGALQEHEARDSQEFRPSDTELAPDVSQAGGPEDRVQDGVGQGVRIGVPMTACHCPCVTSYFPM